MFSSTLMTKRWEDMKEGGQPEPFPRAFMSWCHTTLRCFPVFPPTTDPGLGQSSAVYDVFSPADLTPSEGPVHPGQTTNLQNSGLTKQTWRFSQDETSNIYWSLLSSVRQVTKTTAPSTLPLARIKTPLLRTTTMTLAPCSNHGRYPACWTVNVYWRTRWEPEPWPRSDWFVTCIMITTVSCYLSYEPRVIGNILQPFFTSKNCLKALK